MITIHPIPAFQDNYIWLILNQKNQAIVIDPGSADPVLKYCEQNNIIITHILITHHHADHIGGVEQIINKTNASIFAPASGNYSFCHTKCSDNSSFSLDQHKIKFETITTPGHTLDHVCYHTAGHLFCGDTLFAGGCGRIFEGTASMMLNSLNKIKALPSNTLLYCAHEYTLHNYRFAMKIEPNNQKLQQRFKEVKELRRLKKPTIPSPLQTELDTNPFLRCTEPDVIEAASRYKGQRIDDEVAVFAAIREWKDNF